MPDKNKRRLFVSIHHRDESSIGQYRQQLGYEAYHWGILIEPKVQKGRDSLAIDVSNGKTPGKGLERVELNPNRDWKFRADPVNPLGSTRLLGKLLITKLPHRVATEQVVAVIKAVPVPIKNTAQSCATWEREVLAALQRAEIVPEFDVGRLMDTGLAYGDTWLRESKIHVVVDCRGQS